MISKTVRIYNHLGIHARPAALIVKEAAQYSADIYFSKGETQRINGKSIMGVMMLAAEEGSEVLVEAQGEDAAAAVENLAQLFESNFEV
jgi:phosphocarrier protein